jgi:hypothetical protein
MQLFSNWFDMNSGRRSRREQLPLEAETGKEP